MSNSELSSRISIRLAQDIMAKKLAGGQHVSAQHIADSYDVSRTPVVAAMTELESIGFLKHLPKRGYFVAKKIPKTAIAYVADHADNGQSAYQDFAEDWLNDRLPEVVSELNLQLRYGITKNKVTDMLARAAREGWAERKQGYGWTLLPVAKTAEAFDDIYRFRITIEPAALLEPRFEFDKKVLDEHRRAQEKLIESDVRALQSETLLSSGAQFHEDLIKMSNNPFFHSALVRVNRMRRLMEYRAHVDEKNFVAQCEEHLQLIDIIERGDLIEASYFLRRHLAGALKRKLPIASNWLSQSVLEQDT